MRATHRFLYQSRPYKHLPLILTLAAGAWLVLSAGIYLAGLGFLTLLEMIGGAL